MRILPATLLFFTTTKGHFGRKFIFKDTIQSLVNQNVLFQDSIIHSKVSNCDVDFFNKEQKPIIQSFKYFNTILGTQADWAHFSPSHALEQLKDIIKCIKEVKTEFIFHLEDDWLLHSDKNIISYHLEDAITLLKNKKDVMQVRIPRHLDDTKHYATIERSDLYFNKQGEIWSLNPNMCRTRDIQIICNLIEKNWFNIETAIYQGKLNVELLFASYAKQLSLDEKPFWSFIPERIRALHIGTKEGEEDKI